MNNPPLENNQIFSKTELCYINLFTHLEFLKTPKVVTEKKNHSQQKLNVKKISYRESLFIFETRLLKLKQNKPTENLFSCLIKIKEKAGVKFAMKYLNGYLEYRKITFEELNSLNSH